MTGWMVSFLLKFMNAAHSVVSNCVPVNLMWVILSCLMVDIVVEHNIPQVLTCTSAF